MRSSFTEEIYKKTTKALEALNVYEAKIAPLGLPDIRFTPRIYHQTNYEELREDTELSIQLKMGEIHIYRVYCKSKKYPLRFYFREVRGILDVFVSSIIESPNQQNCDINFSVNRKEFVKKFTPDAEFVLPQFLFIKLQGRSTTFNSGILKITFAIKRQQYLANTMRQNKKVVDMDSLEKEYKKFLTPKRKTVFYNESGTNFLKKNSESIRNFNTLMSSRRTTISLTELKKINAIKLRRNEIQNLKEKERRLKEKAVELRAVFKSEEKYIKQRKTAKNFLLIQTMTFLKLARFLNTLDILREKQIVNKLKNTKFQEMQHRFISNIGSTIKQYRFPGKKLREIASIKSTLNIASHVLEKQAKKHCNKIISNLLIYIAPCQQLNQIFEVATQFRRKVRFLQRYWKERHYARLLIIKISIEKYLKKLFKEHPKLRITEYQFVERKMHQKLGIIYIRQTHQRFLISKQKHKELLNQREQVIRQNILIEQYNQKSLKKHQKHLHIVPKIADLPYSKLYRDLGLLNDKIKIVIGEIFMESKGKKL